MHTIIEMASNHLSIQSKVRLILFLVFPFLVFHWMAPFFGSKSLGNDYVKVPHSEQLEIQFSLKKRTFPLFVPGYAGSTSAVAMSQSQLFHPHSHLVSVMPGYWDGKAREWNTFWRLLYLGIVHGFLFGLARRMGIPNLYSFLISFIAVYNLRMLNLFRYAVGLESFLTYLSLCGCGMWYYYSPAKRWGIMGIVFSTYLLIVSGLPQLSYFGMLGSCFVFLVLPHYIKALSPQNQTSSSISILNYYRNVFGAMGAGILLASSFTIPYFFDFILSNTARVHSGFDFATGYQSESAWDFLKCIFNPWISNVHYTFIGSSLTLLVLLIPFAAVTRIKIPGVILLLWGTTLSILVLGLGSHTPIYYYFWKYFPLADSFRVPGRFMFILPFLLFLLFLWLFKQKEKGVLFLTCIACVLWVFFRLLPWDSLSNPEVFSPLKINQPSIARIRIEGFTGFICLAALVMYLRASERRFIFGVLFVGAAIVQLVLIFELGTWVVKKSPSLTLTQMEKNKNKNLLYGKERNLYIDASMSHHLFYKRAKLGYYEERLARLCPKFRRVDSIEEAYKHIQSEKNRDYIAVERFHQEVKPNSTSIPTSPESKIILEKNTFNQFVFNVATHSSLFFVLSFPFSPRHWECIVNGIPTTIYRANAMDQAVWLKPGMHKIEFRYFSKPVIVGMLISFFTLLVFIWYGLSYLTNERLRVIGRILAIIILCTCFFLWHHSLYHGQNLNTKYLWTLK